MRRWKAAKVAETTEMPAPMLRRYLDRRLIEIDAADIGSPGSGRPRLFGIKTIYRVAITHRLICARVVPNVALRLAALFCDAGEVRRQPGQLFPSGKTVLIAKWNGAATILNIPPDQTIDEHLAGDVSVVVDLGRIVRRVNQRLGLETNADNAAAVLAEFRKSNLKGNHV